MGKKQRKQNRKQSGLKLTIMVSGSFPEHTIIRPIVLEAEVVDKGVWGVSDPKFQRYGYNASLSDAIDECLSDIATYMELARENMKPDSANECLVMEIERYLLGVKD